MYINFNFNQPEFSFLNWFCLTVAHWLCLLSKCSLLNQISPLPAYIQHMCVPLLYHQVQTKTNWHNKFKSCEYTQYSKRYYFKTPLLFLFAIIILDSPTLYYFFFFFCELFRIVRSCTFFFCKMSGNILLFNCNKSTRFKFNIYEKYLSGSN